MGFRLWARLIAALCIVATMNGSIAASAQGAEGSGTGSISGQVVDSNGNSVRAANVTIYSYSGDSLLYLETVSDDGGAFHFADVPHGNWTLYSSRSCEYDGYHYSSGNLNLDDEVVVLVTLEREPCIQLTGIVMDTHGNPIENATVSCGNCRPSWDLAFSDINGRFVTEVIFGRITKVVDAPDCEYGFITGEWTTPGLHDAGVVVLECGDAYQNNDGGTETPGSGDGNETPGNGDGGGTEIPDDGNGDGDGTETPGDGNGEATETPVATPNAFTLTSAQRMCEDQSFNATWNGTNVVSIEFSLSNTSDNWTSGWLPANADSGSFTATVDHHAYDKAVARVTFADGTIQEVSADTNVCAIAPKQPPVTDQPSAPQNPVEVTALPTTGAGQTANISAMSLMAITLTVVAAGGLVVRMKRS